MNLSLISLLLCVFLSSCTQENDNNPNVVKISNTPKILSEKYLAPSGHEFITSYYGSDSRSLTIMHSPECPLCNKRRLYTDSLLLELTKK